VQVTADGIALDVREAPRGDVLRLLAEKTRTDVRGRLADDRPITAKIERASLEEAVRRVLGDQSFLLVYPAGGLTGSLELLGSSGETFTVDVPGSAPGRDEERAAAGDAPPMPGSLRAHPVGGRLSRVLGKSSASFNDLVELASSTDDAALQRAAVEGGLRILDAEPELRTAVLGTVQAFPPEKLARYLVVSMGPRAAGVADAIAQSVGAGGRAKAEAVVREVRALGVAE
ncbi:MAG: hypothetical protein AB1689_04470, partial [Thermodesulfobacteriota bacterium]